jgi:hypothetical protein
MKRIQLWCIVSATLIAVCTARADSYTVSLPAGYSLIANHLNHPGGNTLNNILPNPPPGTSFRKWNCVVWTVYMFDPDDLTWYPNGLATLNPGEGAIINLPVAATLNFTGAPQVPVLPVVLPCLCNQTNLGCSQTNVLSRQTTNAPTTFYDLTGFAPTEGTSLLRHNVGMPAFPTAPPQLHGLHLLWWSLGTQPAKLGHRRIRLAHNAGYQPDAHNPRTTPEPDDLCRRHGDVQRSGIGLGSGDVSVASTWSGSA